MNKNFYPLKVRFMASFEHKNASWGQIFSLIYVSKQDILKKKFVIEIEIQQIKDTM